MSGELGLALGRTRRRCRSGRPAGATRWSAWLERARARGTTEMELVVELHLCRGLPLRDVADEMGLKLKVVRALWQQGRAGWHCGMCDPKSKGDFAALREQVGMALWETVEATFLGPGASASAGVCAGPEGDGEGAQQEGSESGAASVSASVSAPMLGVRMKALKQIAELYGVDPKGKADAKGSRRAEPCFTPEEVVERVREWREREEK